uniref:28 kDa ribonucleoprotein, chloroplastic n=1 Tax=Aegilops tauschii TaxID=37682 RepID=R7WCD7_AEGTA
MHPLRLQLPASGNWVTSYSGTVLRCLTLTIEGLRPSLHDPLTGAAAHLPLFPQSLGLWGEEIDPHGLIYGDGATLLYSISIAGAHVVGPRPTARFTAALLRPGDAEWTILERTLEHEYEHRFRTWSPRQPVLSSVTYHDGKILAVMEADQHWRLVTPNSNIARDELVQSQGTPVVQLWFGKSTCYYTYNHILESRGEILWVSINSPEYDKVSVLALEEPLLSELSPLEKMRWVRKDGRSLADRVLFLGTRHSFVVDAGRVPNSHGGCAYFVYQNENVFKYGKRAVFRCNLMNGKTELVQRLPRCWDYKMCLWFNPESVITPPQEITEGSPKQQHQIAPRISSPPRHTIHIERHLVPSLTVLVRNLPSTVKSNQLRLFFNKHGKVSSAEVICYKKTRASQGIAHVTIETTHSHLEDALAALNELVFDGCHLEVSLIKEGQPPQCPRQRR